MPDQRDCKACRANARDADPYLVWRNDLWVLRHTRPPYAALGWMTLHSQRHAASFTALPAAELADLGPTLARISTAIIAATGALRVYLASMTEMTPHFHAHLVPRYTDGPKGWETFKLKQQAASSTVADADVHAVMEAVRASLG
ncbi:MAG: hypothetical protein ABS75_26020 [Pelagibacterium sp. SCN 63-23]|nr:MAG: hypothetical protein ABS75_26020 [Pelagibacterium sp. SCN 63-23]